MLLITRAEAKAKGLPRYFTGKPCPRGHVTERITANGTCRICSNAMSNTAHKAKPDVVRARHRAWQIENRERLNAQEKARNARNPDAKKAREDRWLAAHPEYRRNFYLANVEVIKQRVREWEAANPERARHNRLAWRIANADRKARLDREWRTQNHEQYLSTRRAYRARKAKAEGTHTGAEILALLDKQGGLCVYCGVSILNLRYHADHIVPLVRGGSNWISNIQLTCPDCNHRKNATDPTEFAKRYEPSTDGNCSVTSVSQRGDIGG